MFQYNNLTIDIVYKVSTIVTIGKYEMLIRIEKFVL